MKRSGIWIKLLDNRILFTNNLYLNFGYAIKRIVRIKELKYYRRKKRDFNGNAENRHATSRGGGMEVDEHVLTE